MKTIYIIGPMLGRHRYNWQAFKNAESELRVAGWNVINPHEEDKASGFDVFTLPEDFDWSQSPPGFDLRSCRLRCVESLEAANAVYVLPGRLGRGSTAELAFAQWRGLDVIWDKNATCGEVGVFKNDGDASALNPAMSSSAAVLEEARRLVCGDRNASYGSPDEDFGRTAAMWSGYLRDLLKTPLGAKDVAWMMMMVKASRSRHDDKRDNYVDAAGYAACGWKCVEVAG